jgi:ribosomal protein L11 methyltransferase
MTWLQITLHTHPDQVELISDALIEIGALSVTCADDGDEPVYEPALNTTPLWRETRVTGLFVEADVEQAELPVLLEMALGSLPLPRYEFSLLEDQEWTRVWMTDFKPMCFGERLWIYPSWQEVPDSEMIYLLLDPGLAFGTGTHPTTALCLTWLATWPELTGKTVIDYGCGSGILAIAAVKLGAAKVWAVDNDPQALLATQDNAQKNQVDQAIQTVFPEQLPIIQVDGIVANILATPLMTLAASFAEKINTDGFIVLSGILIDQADAVIAAYSPYFAMQPPIVQGDWLRIDGIRKLA